MLKDWDFAQFFPNCNMDAPAADTTPPEEKSSSSTSSSGMTPPRMHWRSDSDTTNSVRTLDPLFSARMLWPLPSGRNRMEEPVLTEFSRKASESELRKTASFDFRPVHPLPRRQKTDLDLRRLELKKELEERRRTALRSSRPPLLKSTSEPCAPLTLQQVSSSSSSASPHPLPQTHQTRKKKQDLYLLAGRKCGVNQSLSCCQSLRFPIYLVFNSICFNETFLLDWNRWLINVHNSEFRPPSPWYRTLNLPPWTRTRQLFTVFGEFCIWIPKRTLAAMHLVSRIVCANNNHPYSGF